MFYILYQICSIISASFKFSSAKAKSKSSFVLFITHSNQIYFKLPPPPPQICKKGQKLPYYYVRVSSSMNFTFFKQKYCDKGIKTPIHLFIVRLLSFLYKHSSLSRVNSLPNKPESIDPEKAFQNIVEKNAGGNQHFVLLPHCILSFPTQISIYET